MNNTVLVSLMIIFVVALLLVMQNKNKKLINETYGVYCPDCNRNNWMGESDCYNCSNCGWCIDSNGNGSCGIGSASGPLFKDCRSWYYNGRCMWGPDCGTTGPIYYDNYYWNTPWYTNWWWWGWGGRPYERDYHHHHYYKPHKRRRHRGRSPRRGGRGRSPRRGGGGRSPRRGGGRSPRRGGGRRGGGRGRRR